jgi:hypothetical protein
MSDAIEWGACRVCRVSVPIPQLRAMGGCCRRHQDADDVRGCPECGSESGHTRDCERVT